MKWYLAGAACALFLMGAGVASASPCSSTCDRDYGTCTAQSGGNGQQMCMPKWMQGKKVCSGALRAPTPVSSAPAPPKR
jgi:hypothetical protein